MNGVFAVAKPGGSSGPTSQDVVAKLKKLFTKSPEYIASKKQAQGPPPRKRRRGGDFIKIGHGGTLDPLADGVLVIGVGTGTKQLQNYLGQCKKAYTATALFGAATTTYDSEGAVLGYSRTDSITNEAVEKALEAFKGDIKQLPPVFSALKMDGKPLYEYAREGIPLPRAIEKRECNIETISAGEVTNTHDYTYPEKQATESEIKFAKDVTGEDLSGGSKPDTPGPTVDLEFSVSSGTYIRSLIHDLGRALDTQAHMVKLRRDTQGEWALGKNVLSLDLFDQPHDTWWPVLKNVLEAGPSASVSPEYLGTSSDAGSAKHASRSSEAQPTAVEKGTGEPSAETQAAAEKPAAEEFAAEEPATEEPATEEPAAEEPATEEPAAQAAAEQRAPQAAETEGESSKKTV